ncbi:MAG: SNF2-related protein [Ectothiorhodospira sp.]
MTQNREWITPALLQQECGQNAYTRGRRYFTQGASFRVKRVRQTPMELVFQARTRGSGRRPYEQFVRIFLVDGDPDPHLEGDCSCPMGFNCKHVVSAALTYRDQVPAGELQIQGRSGFVDWLDRIQQQDARREERLTEECLAYHLVPTRTGARVQFRVSRPRKDGTLGKGRMVSMGALAEPYRHASTRYMTETDREIIQLLFVANDMNGYRDPELKGHAGAIALDRMLGTGRVFAATETPRPLNRGAPRELTLEWQREGEQYRLRMGMDQGEGDALPTEPPAYLDMQRFEMGHLVLPEGLDPQWLTRIPDSPPVDAEEAEAVSRRLALDFPQMPTPIPVAWREVREPPVPALAVMLHDEDLLQSGLLLHFLYGDMAVWSHAPQEVVSGETDGELVRVYRDVAAEAKAMETLRSAGLLPFADHPELYAPSMEDTDRGAALGRWLDVLDSLLPRLEAEGWHIEHVRGTRPHLTGSDSLRAEVEEGQGWFDLHFDLEVDGRHVPLLPLVSQLIEGYTPGSLPEHLWLQLEAGEYVKVPREQIEPVLQTLMDLHEQIAPDASALRLSRLDAPRLLELGDVPVQGGASVQEMARKLTSFEVIGEVSPPEGFQGDLRSYQLRGVSWLQFLREYGLAGILADDMGLGKTIQTLAHLALEREAGRLSRPALIVAPTSLLSNWRREAEQFTPDLRVLVLHGPDRKAHLDTLADHDLVLTTYPLLPRDREVLLEQSFSHLILDEAQQIKNPKAQAAQVARHLKAEHRLCLTGTPMENHLGELWAQFDFLLPGFLGTQEVFSRSYRTPIEKHGDQERMQRLTRRIAPFMLRRTKDVVASELPEKTELLRSVPIAGRQAALYESIRLAMERKVRDAIARKGLAGSQITILDALLKLRQVCCDPRLLPASVGRGGEGVPSAKLRMLMELLPELLSEGSRVLIFSQFTTMLGLIEKELKTAGIAYSKLTGQTRKREEAIGAFREGRVPVMLVSLKAGGVGLNLTEADTVIHYDPWWNPAVEAQATDRAHRIGQDKPVFVYKLITENTVEEKILAMQAHKQQLADRVYRTGERAPDQPPIDADMIEALFSAGD